MLALQGYGSSDENSGPEDDKSSTKGRIEVTNGSKPHKNSPEDQIVPINKAVTTLSLQICAAPDVVPTVSSPSSNTSYN